MFAEKSWRTEGLLQCKQNYETPAVVSSPHNLVPQLQIKLLAPEDIRNKAHVLLMLLMMRMVAVVTMRIVLVMVMVLLL